MYIVKEGFESWSRDFSVVFWCFCFVLSCLALSQCRDMLLDFEVGAGGLREVESMFR